MFSLSSPHLQMSGSHSLTARKQGQCYVLQDEQQRQPRNPLGPVGKEKL